MDATLLLTIGLALFSLTRGLASPMKARPGPERWREIVKQTGLKLVAGDWETGRYEAERGGLKVRAELSAKARGAVQTNIIVSPLPDSTLEMTARNLFSGPSLESGDAEFDRAIIVRGDEIRCIATLDRGTRDIVARNLSQHWLQVGGGEISCAKAGVLTEAELRGIIDAMLELAQRLQLDPASIPGRLLKVAHDDEEPRVRTRALAALIVGFGDHPETVEGVEGLGHGFLQETLLQHLEERSDAQGIVLRALERVGNAAAVERLLKLKCDGRLEPLRGAAIAAIQARAGAGEQGWLSLSADHPSDGGLSTADEAGALAIAEPEKD